MSKTAELTTAHLEESQTRISDPVSALPQSSAIGLSLMPIAALRANTESSFANVDALASARSPREAVELQYAFVFELAQAYAGLTKAFEAVAF